MTPVLIYIVLLFFFGLLSKRLENTMITGPMVFTIGGVLVGFTLPISQQIDFGFSAITILGKLALALVLFTDTTRIWVREVASSTSLPGRLLGIGMPLTIIFGSLVASLLFPGLGFWEAAILATLLAPTDAGLGQVVVHSSRIPVRIRQALNVEAGLNDGLALPFLMLFIGLARVDEPLAETSWILFVLQQIGYAVLIGAVFGFVGGWLLRLALRRDWMTNAFKQLCLLALMILTFFITDILQGNEFIAVFIAGLAVKVGFEDAGEEMVEFSEAWGDLLNFFIFFIFGTAAAGIIFKASPQIWLYAVLSLTLVRILPVAISLIRTRLHPASVLFLGWFGPRGLASITLGLIFLKQEADIPGQTLVTMILTITILLSIFAHGLTAVPGINLYARRLERYPPESAEKNRSLISPS